MSFDRATFAVRRAQPGDAEALALVIETAWNVAYRGILSDAAFEELRHLWTQDSWRQTLLHPREAHLVLAAVDEDDDPVGVAHVGPDRFGGQNWAEIHMLYVMPGYQRLGLGRRLLCEAFRLMSEAGFTSGIIWALSAADSGGFYARLGGKEMYHRDSIEGGQSVAQTGYVWLDLAASFAEAAVAS